LSIKGLEETRELIKTSNPEATVEISILDITSQVAVEKFFSIAVTKFGRIDFAANVAGYAHVARPIQELSMVEYDKSYTVNQKGV
jgi:NADP-dependent 3-hydroxy acid dehydrogenase YdfG